MDSVRELKTDVFTSVSSYVTCPYNPSHRILRARLQYHLVKCRRNVKEKPEEEKVICPLDATHHINKEEIGEHIKVCPNRKIVDSERYLMDSEVSEPASTYLLPDMPPCEENWDDPSDQPCTYQPVTHLQTQPILRIMHGATKSERRAFRQVERLRMIQYMSGQPMNTDAAAAAVGVTIVNGRYKAHGRGRENLPLAENVTMRNNNNNNVGRGRGYQNQDVEGACILPRPVEAGPLRPPKEQSIAFRLSQSRIADDEDIIRTNASRVDTNNEREENSDDAGVVSGSGLNPRKEGGITESDDRTPPVQDWWNHNDNNRVGRTTVNLEEYKQRVSESKLAAKMGLPTSENNLNDESRARDFTYLDDEWRVQGRRGRATRGNPSARPNTGSIPKRNRQ